MAKKKNIVKSAKSNLQLIVILLVVVGWLCGIMAITSNEDEKAQEALIQQAQIYLEDQLYIRAVNNYQEALNNYKTENNLIYENQLVDIYKTAGMQNEYMTLLLERIEAETAQEEEYLVIAQYYIEKRDNREALKVLNAGVERFDDEKMNQLREEIRYEYEYREINLSELVQPENNWLIPAFDGNKWGYIKQDGKVVLDFIYDEATQFAGSYAVVKLEGVYTLIDRNGYWNAVDKVGLDKVVDISSTAIVAIENGEYKLYTRTFNEYSEEGFECIYLNDNGLFVVKRNGKWAILDEELKNVTDYVFTDVAVNSRGTVFTGDFAVVKDESGYFHISTDGKPLYDIRFVNAKGYEGGLIAVADASGKWGFASGSGTLVVDYQYGDAYSFSAQLGAVKYGGKWGYINRYNQMQIEAEFVVAYPFINEYAIAQTQTGNYYILTLENYDLF